MGIVLSADLTGRTALVTGGISGIGLATARLLAEAGATVAVNHLPDDPRAPEVIGKLTAEGLKIVAAPGDVGGDLKSVGAFVGTAIDRLGRLDFLINNAGVSQTTTPIAAGDLDALDDAFWSGIFNVNLFGGFRCLRAAKPALNAAEGAVVSTASVSGFRVPGSSIAYSASKAGLIKLTTDLGRSLAPEIRVNAVAPGFVRTDWTSTWDQAVHEQLKATTPLGGMTEPEDVAQCALYLCCARFVTGQTIVVDGGLTL